MDIPHCSNSLSLSAVSSALGAIHEKSEITNADDECAEFSRKCNYFHPEDGEEQCKIFEMELTDELQSSEYIDLLNGRGLSNFHAACLGRDADKVKDFLLKGVDINQAVDEDAEGFHLHGYTPLHLAVHSGSVEVVAMLLNYGADVTLQNLKGLTPLQLAFQKYPMNDHIIDLIFDGELLLFKNGKATSHNGFSSFHAACTLSRFDIIESFLQCGVDIDCAVDMKSHRYHGYTPLHIAVVEDKLEIVKLLQRFGANVDTRNLKGETPLHLASHDTNLEIMRILVQSGADINAKSKPYNETPLHKVLGNFLERSRYDLFKVVEMLVTHHADVNCVELDNLRTPLHTACIHNQFEIIDLLLANKGDVDVRDKFGETPFHNLASLPHRRELDMDLVRRYNKTIGMFLKTGWEIDTKNSQGVTALLKACVHNHQNFAYALLLNGATVDIQNSESNKPFLDWGKTSCLLHIFLYDFENLKFINSRIGKNESLYAQLKNFYRNDKFHQKCVNELDKMKNTRINLGTSLYDTMFTSIQNMSIHVKNSRLVEILKSDGFERSFPIYGSLLESQFNKGIIRASLKERMKDFLQFLTKSKLPDLCLEKISEYFTNEDLNNLIDAKLFETMQLEKSL